MAGTHRRTGDLGIDEQRATDELQRQLVSEHLLERRHGKRGIGGDRGALLGMTPQLVGASGDDLRERFGAADEEGDELVDHFGVVERAVAAVEREQAVDDVGRIAVELVRPSARGDETAEVVVDLASRAAMPSALMPGFARLTLHVPVDQRDEGDAVSRWHVDQASRDRGGDRRRIVVPHVEAAPFGERVELRGGERAHVVLEPGDRAWPERIDHRLAQARVMRRIEHRETAHRTAERTCRARRRCGAGVGHDGTPGPSTIEKRSRSDSTRHTSSKRGNAHASYSSMR